MKFFYLVLFCAAGLFNILAAVLNWKWYIDYWVNKNNSVTQRRKTNKSVRIAIFVIGILLSAYGIAAGLDLI